MTPDFWIQRQILFQKRRGTTESADAFCAKRPVTLSMTRSDKSQGGKCFEQTRRPLYAIGFSASIRIAISILGSGTLFVEFLTKSSKSTDIDLKNEVFESENPKTDPFGIDLGQSRRRESNEKKSLMEFWAPGTPVFPGKYGLFRHYGGNEASSDRLSDCMNTMPKPAICH